MENEIGKENPQNDQPDGQDNPETVDVSQETDAAALQKKVQELSDTNRKLFSRAKQAEGFEFNEESRRWMKKEIPPAKDKIEVAPEATTGELSETQLDYLDLKGITDDEELKVIKSVMQRTGLTVRKALNDEYVQVKLKEIKDRKSAQAATPSSNRGGQVQNDRIDWWLVENERTGKLPDDFDLRVKVVEAKERKYSTATPPWRK